MGQGREWRASCWDCKRRRVSEGRENQDGCRVQPGQSSLDKYNDPSRNVHDGCGGCSGGPDARLDRVDFARDAKRVGESMDEESLVRVEAGREVRRREGQSVHPA